MSFLLAYNALGILFITKSIYTYEIVNMFDKLECTIKMAYKPLISGIESKWNNVYLQSMAGTQHVLASWSSLAVRLNWHYQACGLMKTIENTDDSPMPSIVPGPAWVLRIFG